MKKIQCITGIAVFMAVAMTQAETVVYQSDFTGSTLASAELVQGATASTGSWAVDGTNLQGVGGGNARSHVYTSNSWQSTAGFTLDVTFFVSSSNNTRHEFAIVESTVNPSAGVGFLGGQQAGYGLGFVTAGELGAEGLAFNSGGSTAMLSTAQGGATHAASETMSITVTADSWSYSLNGATATTGSFTFDTSKSYKFIAYAHRNGNANFQNITITAIPAPSVITWGAATPISISSDVSTIGELVEAFNTGGTTSGTDVTVNGVPFTGTATFLDNNSNIDFFTSDNTGDAAYDELLSSIDFGNGADRVTKEVGNGNLVVGEEYLIQVWYVDDRGGAKVMRFGDGNGNTVDLNSVPGQYVIGSFTANSTTQDLTLDAQNLGNAHITAYQIRSISTLDWDGSTDSTWTNPDATSWSGETYDDGDAASFAETGAGTVTLSGSVAPYSVAVNATADYTFTGDDISGATGLTKSGTGTLTLASANTYTGVTTISGGILTVGDNAALGDVAGNTVVSGGSLRMEGGISLAEPLDISGGNNEAPALWNTVGNNTVTGAITGGGRIQTEAGTLTLSGGLTHTGDVSITGDLVVDTTPFSVTGAMSFAGDSYNIGDPEYVSGRTIVLDPITGTHDWTYTQIWFSALVELGANDIMPTDTDVRFGWTTVANSLARLDLKSFDQTVASIETAAQSLDVGGDVEITDSTGSGTLTVNQATDTEYQGRLTGGLTLIKSGAGTLTLNNLSGTATSHTGATTVAAGTLSLLTDITASAMTVNSGASLELTLGTSVTSSALTLDGGSTIKVIGTPTLSSYTLITASSISGTPVLDAAIAGYELVVNGLSLELNEVAGYTSWAAGYPGLTDTDSTLDFDGGSLETGLEYVLDSDPTDASDDLTVAPTSTYTGTALEFDYRRSDVANDDPSTTIEVEYNSDLATSWTTAADGVNGVSITVNDDFYGAGIDQVVVSLPDSLAAGKLFARLNVTTAP